MVADPPVGGRSGNAQTDVQAAAASGDCTPPHGGEMQMTAMDLLGLLLIAFLVAPMVTARPGRY